MGSIKRDRECLMVKWKDLDDKIVLSMTSDQMESISFVYRISYHDQKYKKGTNLNIFNIW